MRSDYLSTFKASRDDEPGGVKVIPITSHVVPVSTATYPLDLSLQARDIHAWLIKQPAGGVLVRDIIRIHGFRHPSPFFEGKTLRGFPLEELYDHSLLFVEEERQPTGEGV